MKGSWIDFRDAAACLDAEDAAYLDHPEEVWVYIEIADDDGDYDCVCVGRLFIEHGTKATWSFEAEGPERAPWVCDYPRFARSRRTAERKLAAALVEAHLAWQRLTPR